MGKFLSKMKKRLLRGEIGNLQKLEKENESLKKRITALERSVSKQIEPDIERLYAAKKKDFPGFHFQDTEIDLSEAMMISKTRMEMPGEKRSGDYEGMISRLLNRPALSYEVHIKDENKILFFYAADFYRSANLEKIKKVIVAAGAADYIVAAESTPPHSFSDADRKSREKVLTDMRDCFYERGFSGYEAASHLNALTMIVTADSTTPRVDFSKYELLVVYYDQTPSENAMVQAFRAHGVKTATLQHGVFVNPSVQDPRYLYEMPFAFDHSKTDLFLAWNKWTKRQAVSAGMNEKDVLVLGSPADIGVKYEGNISASDSGHFAVLLSASEFDAENRKMIELANDLAKHKGLKYYLRYHPTMRNDRYREIVESSVYDDKDVNDIKLMSLAIKIDFAFCYNTSVYVELLTYGATVYHYRDFGRSDTYKSIDDGAFGNVDELIACIDAGAEESRKARAQFGIISDSRERYKSFFADVRRGIYSRKNGSEAK